MSGAQRILNRWRERLVIQEFDGESCRSRSDRRRITHTHTSKLLPRLITGDPNRLWLMLRHLTPYEERRWSASADLIETVLRFVRFAPWRDQRPPTSARCRDLWNQPGGCGTFACSVLLRTRGSGVRISPGAPNNSQSHQTLTYPVFRPLTSRGSKSPINHGCVPTHCTID